MSWRTSSAGMASWLSRRSLSSRAKPPRTTQTPQTTTATPTPRSSRSTPPSRRRSCCASWSLPWSAWRRSWPTCRPVICQPIGESPTTGVVPPRSSGSFSPWPSTTSITRARSQIGSAPSELRAAGALGTRRSNRRSPGGAPGPATVRAGTSRRAQLVGGIEAGGTKFVCAVGTDAGEILAQDRFRTTTPGETIVQAIKFFRAQEDRLGAAAAIGIASFGPIDLNPRSPTYGSITSPPKAGWAGAPLLGRIRDGLHVPIRIDTDVNAAALAEWRWGSAKTLDTFLYLTVGTGIGGGGLVNGRPIHGLVHPQMGHVP